MISIMQVENLLRKRVEVQHALAPSEHPIGDMVVEYFLPNQEAFILN